MKICETLIKIVNYCVNTYRIITIIYKVQTMYFQICPFLWKRELLFEAFFFLSLLYTFLIMEESITVIENLCSNESLCGKEEGNCKITVKRVQTDHKNDSQDQVHIRVPPTLPKVLA